MICVDTSGPIARLILGCDKRAVFDEVLLSEISTAVASLVPQPEIEVIVIDGGSPAFLTGVDLNFFAECLQRDAVSRIVSFTQAAHDLLRQIEESRKPVIAFVRGAAYGAGLELALACHRVVATPNAKFAFPETGLGIYPGMGGTQRLPRRIGVGLAKWMIYSGAIVPAVGALEIGLIDAILPEGRVLESIAEIPAAARTALALSARMAAVERLFAANALATLCDPTFPMPADPHLVRLLVQVRAKPRMAMKLAEQIIDRGTTMPLANGIAEEFRHLPEAFATEEARAGILAAAEAIAARAT